MKNGIDRVILLSLLAILSGLVLFLCGCEDPGPVGVVVIYDRVEVHDASRAPRISDYKDDIWNEASLSVIRVGDSAAYTDDFGARSINLQAIRAAGRLYVKISWSDQDYDAWPEYLWCDRDTLSGEIGVIVPGTIIDTLVDTIYHVTDTLLDTSYTIVNTIPDDYLRIDSVVSDSSVNYETVSWTRLDAFELGYEISGEDTTFYNRGADQDRVAIMWGEGGNDTVKADCFRLCHETANPSGHHMYTNNTDHVDVWHWQSAKTDPLYLALDEYWNTDGPQIDAGQSLAHTSNFDEINIRPLSMHTSGAANRNPFLLAEEAVSFDSAVNWPDLYRMPGFVLHDITPGSATDVSAFSWYKDSYYSSGNTWTVLMSRALTTGNSDDIDFGVLNHGDSVMVTVAVMDNADRLHSGSTPFYFIFK